MSRAERKQATRDAIVAAAAERMRRDGIDSVSVAEVMAEAGLTVGGFYAHFPSKDALAAAAIGRAIEENAGTLLEGLDGAPARARRDAVIRRYLSRQHRDDPQRGCPLPACVGDVDPERTELSDAVAAAVEGFAARLGPLYDALGPEAQRSRAIGALCAFVGALALARATRGELSDEILLAARQLLFDLEEP